MTRLPAPIGDDPKAMATEHRNRHGPTRPEQKVLEDLKRRTGLVAPRLALLDTADEEVSKAVLPVLAEWASKSDENIRTVIYSLFATPHARSWIDLLLSAWPRWEGPLEGSALVSALCATAGDNNARRIFDTMSRDPAKLEDFRLLAKLSEFTSVGRLVKDYVVRALKQRDIRAGDLQDISKIRDPRISEELRKRENSRDPAVRLVARRYLAKIPGPRRDICIAESAPDRQTALYSAEVDVTKLKRLLGLLARKFGLQISSTPLKDAESLMLAFPGDRWIVVNVKGGNQEDLRVWLRLEDIDIVEVVVSPSADKA